MPGSWSWQTSVGLPFVQLQGTVVEWDEVRFDVRLLQRVPYEGVSRMTTSLRRKHRDRVVRRGIGMTIESDFYATEAGRQHFRDQLTSIRYSFYLPAELRQLSVKRITNVTQRDALSRPMAGGLYDPALGPTDHFESCVTCGLDYSLCPGHFGHIDLALPAYNQLLFPLLYSLLRSKCLHCDRFRLGVERLGNCVDALSLLEAGMISEATVGPRVVEQWVHRSTCRPSPATLPLSTWRTGGRCWPRSH